MGRGPQWTATETKFLINNYSRALDKELANTLGRSVKAISYAACKLRLEKARKFYCKSRKKLNFEITKDVLLRLYFDERNSIRRIAEELGVGKTTIEHYFAKYKINKRSKSEANKIGQLKFSWIKGKSKENDPRVNFLAQQIKLAYKIKRAERFKQVEQKFRKPLKDIINDLYWKENLIQDKIAEVLGVDRKVIIDLMRKYDISKKPNFRIIASLKGKKHAMFGKTWEGIYGPEEAARIRKEASLRSRRLIIKRLQNNEMPFINTKIEIAVAEELKKRGILFESQYPIDNKFVCDFAIPKFKIAVECDGDYWHANPNIYDQKKLNKIQAKKVRTDRFKEKYLAKKGWKLFRFFETDILASAESCVDSIEAELKKIKSPLD